MTERQAWIVKPGHSAPTEAQFKPVAGVDCLNKPGRVGHTRLGLWTSTWLGLPSICGWAEWCGHEDFAGPEYQVFLLTPAPAAKVYEIDTMADLLALLDAYGAQGEMFRVLGRSGMFPEMDFDRFVADGYVGVHLTDEGQWRTRGMDSGINDPNLYGWDCESTLWCRWAFTEVEDAGVLSWSNQSYEKG